MHVETAPCPRRDQKHLDRQTTASLKGAAVTQCATSTSWKYDSRSARFVPRERRDVRPVGERRQPFPVEAVAAQLDGGDAGAYGERISRAIRDNDGRTLGYIRGPPMVEAVAGLFWST